MFTKKKDHMRSIKMIAALSMAASLVACGGGGDSGPPAASVTSSAEGFWTGTSSNGKQVAAVILENGETWGVYSSGGVLAGAIYGNINSSDNTISGSGLDFYNGTSHAGTLSGNVAPKSSINLTSSSGVSFSGTYSNAYEQAASLTNLAGTYSGYGLSARTSAQYIPVTIASNGTISAGDANCAATGTASPRASGKNVFDIQVNFTGNYCALGNGAVVNGIAYYDASSRSMIAMGLNGNKTDGFIYLGSK